MFDLKELLKVQQKLQLSFAGNVNALFQNGASFKAARLARIPAKALVNGVAWVKHDVIPPHKNL